MNKRNFPMIDLISTVCDISDLEYQKRVWVRGEGPEVDCFIETAEGFLSGYDGFKDFDTRYEEYGLTKEQFLVLKALRQKIYDYNGFDSDEEIINDPKWLEIVNFAKIVYKKLHRNSDKMPYDKD